MAENLKIREVHERRAVLQLSKAQLENLLTDHAFREAGLDRDATTVSIKFEDETAGSPAYRIGTRVTITMIEDQTVLGAAKE